MVVVPVVVPAFVTEVGAGEAPPQRAPSGVRWSCWRSGMASGSATRHGRRMDKIATPPQTRGVCCWPDVDGCVDDIWVGTRRCPHNLPCSRLGRWSESLGPGQWALFPAPRPACSYGRVPGNLDGIRRNYLLGSLVPNPAGKTCHEIFRLRAAMLWAWGVAHASVDASVGCAWRAAIEFKLRSSGASPAPHLAGWPRLD